MTTTIKRICHSQVHIGIAVRYKKTAWLPLYKGQSGRFLKSFPLPSFLFAVTILHRPLQSVTITEVAGPSEIFTGFSGLLQLEISQTPIKVGL